jgi:hypothetical protein
MMTDYHYHLIRLKMRRKKFVLQKMVGIAAILRKHP